MDQHSSSIVIERGVPIPTGPGAPKYPFRDMQIGDSFAVSTADLVRVRGALNYFQRTSSAKFTIRKTENGYRCWRFA